MFYFLNKQTEGIESASSGKINICTYCASIPLVLLLPNSFYILHSSQ